jgi:pyruvate dehydrogenase E2 component (dihydrolipoamide acetyltransferase)
MAEIVIMPKLGFDMAEGTLVKWVVPEGEKVDRGTILAEIETDKATVEVESSYSGVVHRHLVEEGTSVPIGEPIAVIGEEGEEINLDDLLGEEAPEAETGLKAGAPVEDQEAMPRDGAAERVEEEARVAPGEVEAEEREPVREEAAPDERMPGGVKASPIARRIATEQGIDLRKIKGSGPDGRIVKADVEGFEEAPPKVEEKPPKPVPTFEVGPREDQHIPLSRLRAIIGKRMTRSSQQIPQFYVTHEYDVAALLDVRKQINAMLPDEEKISVNDFIVKATALCLREFPNLNAALDEDKEEVVQFGNVNIGVAVAVENGLLTVVCRDVDVKPLRVISSELRDMVTRARDGRVRPEDIEGSTFSISNMGMLDVEHFTAIINPPEAAILAVGSARHIPVVMDGELKPGVRMKATITIDHRVSDGAEAAQFMQSLTRYLEQPMRLLV